MRQRRRCLIQGHSSRKWECWDPNPATLYHENFSSGLGCSISVTATAINSSYVKMAHVTKELSVLTFSYV